MTNSNNFEMKLQEYLQWTVRSGKYAFSTMERRQGRIRYLSRYMDFWEPNLNRIYNFVIEQQKSGKKRKSITEDMIYLESWFKFIGKDVSLPRLKKEPAPSPEYLLMRKYRIYGTTSGTYTTGQHARNIR